MPEAPISNYQRVNLLDNQINLANLQNNIKLVTESIMSMIFDYESAQLTVLQADKSIINDEGIENLINFLKKISRSPLSLVKKSPLNKYILDFVKTFLVDHKVQTFEFTETKFFNSNSGNMRIYEVKTKLIDLYLIGIILSYLLCIFVYVKGFGALIKSFIGIFSVESD